MDTRDLDLGFHPWIGEHFGAPKTMGCRVLVLGESHYSAKSEPPTFTQALTADYIAGRMRHRFWTSVARLLLGTNASFAERVALWQEVAFYNYVQEIVGARPKMRPSDRAWSAARQPFLAVLTRLRPDAVLVLGKALWFRLPPGTETALTVDGRPRPARLYEHSAGACIATFVPHPASMGFSWRKWRSTAAELLQAGSART